MIYYSHPKILLKQHLIEVATCMKDEIESLNLTKMRDLSYQIEKEHLEIVAFLIGLFHARHFQRADNDDRLNRNGNDQCDPRRYKV